MKYPSLRIEQPHTFNIKGPIEVTAPVLNWITENTTSYILNGAGILIGCQPGHDFAFTVVFTKDADAVRFKMTWQAA